MTWFADRSLSKHPAFDLYKEHFDIRFAGGAVMNIVQLLTQPQSIYCKAPKPVLGGCAIWDLAAVALMVEECAGHTCFFDGHPLHLNRPETHFFNDVGLFFASADVDADKALALIKELGAHV